MKMTGSDNLFVCSRDGWFAGVCQGLGERFDINPGMLRLIWFASASFYGVGVLLYLVCAFVMPLEGDEEKVNEAKFLGVCYRLALRLDVEVALVRIVSIMALVGSGGTVILLYFLLHFLMPNPKKIEN